MDVINIMFTKRRRRNKTNPARSIEIKRNKLCFRTLILCVDCRFYIVYIQFIIYTSLNISMRCYLNTTECDLHKIRFYILVHIF